MSEHITKVCMDRSAQGCDIIVILEYWIGSGTSYSESITLSTSEEIV